MAMHDRQDQDAPLADAIDQLIWKTAEFALSQIAIDRGPRDRVYPDQATGFLKVC